MREYVLLTVVAAAPLLAADFWEQKQPSDWNEKEVRKLLANSPWARSASVNFSGQSPGLSGGGGRGGRRGMGGFDASSGGPRVPGGGGMGGGGMGSEAGGGGMGGSGGGPGAQGPPPAPRVTIRWESAEPLREAAVRVEDPKAPKLAELAKQFYIITVAGLPLFGGRERGERSLPDRARLQQIQQRLKQTTSLKRKGKDPIAPAQVELISGPAGPVVAFLFPRRDPITLEDKDVSFESVAGPLEVKSKFGLKKMVYRGKLEL